MKKSRTLGLLLAAGLCCAAALDCGPHNGSSNPVPSPSPLLTTIQNIRQAPVATTTLVQLTGVVVTEVRVVTGGNDFFVQDAGGGEFTGMFVPDATTHRERT